MIISICRRPRKSSLRSPTVVLHQRSRAAAPLATLHLCRQPALTCSVQESRRRKDSEDSELAHHSGRGRKSSERNDVNAQPTLHNTSHDSAGGKAEERERGMDRLSVRFLLRRSHTAPSIARDSCTPGGLSTPGGCRWKRN